MSGSTDLRVARAAGGNARAMLPRTAAFWLVAGVLFLLFFAAAAPSPLYGVYQARWRFSATTLTAVFAAYALLLLVTLLVFGPVSDYLGRRPVILVGLAMAAGACGLFLAAAAAVLAMRETAPRRPGALASLRPRVAVPRQARRTFAMAVPCLVAVWMISGFYLSLGPSLAAQVLRSPDLLWGGLVIFLLNGIGTAAALAASRASGPAAMLAGCLGLLAGTVVTLAAIQTASAPVLLAGAVAGAGFGAAMLGTFRTITALAAPGQRAGLIAAYYIASYPAFGVPVVIAGVAVTHVGLHRTALIYSAVTAVLAATAAAGLIIRRAGGAAQPSAGEMP